jgi:hypothetical protein
VGLAPEREKLRAAGLSSAVIETMQKARAPSTLEVYGRKWEAFVVWCKTAHPLEEPVSISVEVILDFLQACLVQKLKPSTIRGYLAAIDICHLGLEGFKPSKHPWVSQFMDGVKRDNLSARPLVPSWDLEVVLRGLGQAPFEPLESIPLKFLSLKTALLLALTTAKRVGDLHALSVAEGCLRFANGDRKVLLKPHLQFIPKNKVVQDAPVEIFAFHPPPFGSEEDERLNFLCPVRALKVYCERTRDRRQSSRLFVSHGKSTKKTEIGKATLSGWIVEAINLAYDSAKVARPFGLKAHSTRGVSASWALAKGTSIQEVCLAANWKSPSTFTAHYQLDLAPRSLAQSVLQVAVSSS